MSYEPEDPRSDWDPLGWEWEGPDEHSSGLAQPRAAELVAWVPQDSPPPQSRGPAVAMLVASVLLAVLGLVGIGIGVGSIFFNQGAPPPEIVVVSGPRMVSAPAQAPELRTPLADAPSDRPRSDEAPGTGQTALSPVPDDPVVAVARAVIPSVVLIEVNAPEADQDSPILPEPGTQRPDGPQRYGQGSGIVYDASGLILTNAHVLGEADTVRVQFADGTRAQGVVVGAASAIDVGLVRVDTDFSLTPAVFADRSTVEVGQLAVAVGSPFGLQQSVTSGIVSAVGRAVREGTGDSAFVEMIQTDAPINPGNSGGALANRSGHVIGMNTLIQTDGRVSGNIGLGFAIPSDIALNIAERILKGESTELGYLGVWGTDPKIGEPGALIVEVQPSTPAGEAGLLEGDLIVKMDDEAVSTFTELAAKVQFRVPGTEVKLEVVRDGTPITLTAVIGSRPVSPQSGVGDEE